MTHILLTNDDGIQSPGLHALKSALDDFATVSVIAPDRNRSAIARGITIHAPLHVEERTLPDGSPAFATDGTPVDCVRFAALGLVGRHPDMVVSGVNLGLNLGDDVTYSGTVAAALEGLMLGLPAIAVSQEYGGPEGERHNGAHYDFGAVAAEVRRLAELVSSSGFPTEVMLNVNAPIGRSGVVPEVRATRLGRRIYNDELTLEHAEGPRRRYTIYSDSPSHHPEPGTDFEAIEAGAISVTPLHFSLTAADHLPTLRTLLER